MKNLSRIARIALRIVFGFVFTAAGAAGLLQLGPPPTLSGPAGAYMGGLVAAGYFLPVLKTVELGAGLLLLSGRFVPLALTVLAPIVVHIALFHFLLASEGALVAAFLLVAEAGLALMYRDAFAPLFQARSTPAPRAEEPAHLTSTFDAQAGEA
jgi:uncharacterized membrane protein YphA (DoxX/SURF4 family)